MGVLQWPSVALSGEGQTIPPVCPNCMGPAEVQYRYAYRSPFFFFSRTSYFQSFGYCRRCEPLMDAYFRWQGKGCLVYVLYIAAIGGGVAAAASVAGKGRPLEGNPVVFTALLLAPVVLLWFLLRTWRRSLLAKHPLQEGQLRQGPAAYYTGQTMGGLGNKHVYRALRPEWLAALVRANPGSVDAATYARVTGEQPPTPSDRKPFG
jgi:hypothetical protein